MAQKREVTYASQFSSRGHMKNGSRTRSVADWAPMLSLSALGCILGMMACGKGSSPDGSGSNPSTFSMSGYITGATAVTVNLTGAANASSTTDESGYYLFGSLANGSYG